MDGYERDEFYHSGKLGVVPLDFYFPGKGKQGDLPPRKGFAEKWHERVLSLMPQVSLTLLIGAYAQKYYLQKRRQKKFDDDSGTLPRLFARLLSVSSPITTQLWLDAPTSMV